MQSEGFFEILSMLGENLARPLIGEHQAPADGGIGWIRGGELFEKDDSLAKFFEPLLPIAHIRLFRSDIDVSAAEIALVSESGRGVSGKARC